MRRRRRRRRRRRSRRRKRRRRRRRRKRRESTMMMNMMMLMMTMSTSILAQRVLYKHSKNFELNERTEFVAFLHGTKSHFYLAHGKLLH